MATKRRKADSPFGVSELSGLPLAPLDGSSPSRRSPARTVAGVLDTALLVLVLLVAVAIAWWALSAVIGTIIFFAKLAALALVIAVLLRTWVWVRRRRR